MLRVLLDTGICRFRSLVDEGFCLTRALVGYRNWAYDTDWNRKWKRLEWGRWMKKSTNWKDKVWVSKWRLCLIYLPCRKYPGGSPPALAASPGWRCFRMSVSSSGGLMWGHWSEGHWWLLWPQSTVIISMSLKSGLSPSHHNNNYFSPLKNLFSPPKNLPKHSV